MEKGIRAFSEKKARQIDSEKYWDKTEEMSSLQGKLSRIYMHFLEISSFFADPIIAKE